MTTDPTNPWVRTGRAEELLCRTRRTLFRWVDQGYLTAGTHYLRGPGVAAPITWNIPAIRDWMASQQPITRKTDTTTTGTTHDDHEK